MTMVFYGAALSTNQSQKGVSFSGDALHHLYYATKFERRGLLLYSIFAQVWVHSRLLALCNNYHEREFCLLKGIASYHHGALLHTCVGQAETVFEVNANFKQVMAAKPQSDLLECKEAFENLLRFDAQRCSTVSLCVRA
jgi:hypothetical protein